MRKEKAARAAAAALAAVLAAGCCAGLAGCGDKEPAIKDAEIGSWKDALAGAECVIDVEDPMLGQVLSTPLTKGAEATIGFDGEYTVKWTAEGEAYVTLSDGTKLMEWEDGEDKMYNLTWHAPSEFDTAGGAAEADNGKTGGSDGE